MRRFLGMLAIVAVGVSSALASTPAPRDENGGHRIAAFVGERGCTAVSGDDVVVVPHGFLIVRLKEFVPYDEAQPSPDGRYWHCAIDGQRSRFLAPDTAD